VVAVPTYVRVLVRIAESGLDWLMYPIDEESAVAQWTGTYELRELVAHFSRTPATGVVQDDDLCTFHFLNLTAGEPDATWTTTDYTQVETAFDTMWTALKAFYNSETKLSEYYWRADGPAFKPHGSSLSGPLRITPKSVPGTMSDPMLPPQVSIAVTEVTEAHYTAYGVGVPGSVPGTGRTQTRNRWGRVYWPAVGSDSLSSGRIKTVTCTGFANAMQAFYNDCVGNDIIPVMYSPTTGNAWSITEIRVDDIFDVMRSRRYDTPLVRTPRAIDAP